MAHNILSLLKAIALALFLGLASYSYAQTSYTSNLSGASGDWDNAASWTPAGIPGAADDATVLVGDTIRITGTEQVNDLLIDGVIEHFGKTLTVNGSYEVNGLHQSDENITFNGAGETIDGTGSVILVGNKDFQVNDDRTISATADLIISLDAGTQDMVLNTATLTNEGRVELIGGMKKGGASGAWVNAANSELLVFGDISTTNFTFTASSSGNLVDYRGGSKNVIQPVGNTYHDLRIRGSGTKTLTGNITINGDFDNSVTFDANGFDMDVKGDWTNTATFTPGTGEVIFSGTSDQTINGADTYYDLDISTSSGQLTASGNLVVENVLTINGIALTGSNKITVGTAVGTGSVTFTSGAVVGKLERYTSAAMTQSIDFHVGGEDFDKNGYKLTTLNFSSSTITAGGSILVEFINSVPGNGGAPWIEISTYNNTFADGYWRVTNLNSFAATTFDLDLKIDELEGFAIDNSERVLAGTSPTWTFVAKGTHGTNDGINVTRLGLTAFEDFALASTNSCTVPTAPTFTAEVTSTCIGNSDLYEVNFNSGFTYYWSVTGGTFQENGLTNYNAVNDNNITVDWGITGGSYQVQVTAFDPGCTFSDVSTSSVTLEPFSTSSISGRTVLEQNTPDEPYSVTNLGGNYSYTWTINGGTQDMGAMTESITVDWGTQGSASVVVKSSTTDCPAVFSPEETLNVTLFSTFATVADGDLDDDAAWEGGSAPTDLDNIKIQHIMTDGAAKRYTHVIITAAGTLTTSKDFEITGVFDLDGTLTSTNQSVILNASNDYDITGIGTLVANTVDFTGSNRKVDSLAALTFDVSSVIDLQGVTLANEGSITLFDQPFSGTGSVTTTDPDNVIIYGGAGAQDFAATSVLPAYYNLTISNASAKQLQGDISVNGDFTQSGTASLDAATNTARVTLSGTAAQTLSGMLDFYDLTVNNTFGTAPQITNSGTTTVSNSATLTDGVIINSGTLTFSDATATSTANSYVDGPVVFVAGGNTSFTCPTGDGSIWARMGLGTLTSGSQFTCQYFYTDPQVAFGTAIDATDFPNPSATVSTEEYWQLDYGGGGASSAIVTLYWEDGARSGISTLADLTITKWDGSDWGNDGGILTTTSGSVPTGTVISTTAYTSFSPFTFASSTGMSPLPVELIYFEARAVREGVDLTWETAQEIDNEYFEIQRSIDAENFQSIGQVDGHGNSLERLSYFYRDNYPEIGLNYYRLKQVDFDGSTSYSKLQVVDVLEQRLGFIVYPNPSTDGFFKVESTLTSEKTGVQVRIFDFAGKLVHTFRHEPGGLKWQFEFDMRMKPGIYLLELRQGNYHQIQKVMVN